MVQQQPPNEATRFGWPTLIIAAVVTAVLLCTSRCRGVWTRLQIAKSAARDEFLGHVAQFAVVVLTDPDEHRKGAV